MATFYVGQRVRLISHFGIPYRRPGVQTVPVGTEGVIVGGAYIHSVTRELVYSVDFAGHGFTRACCPESLAPLTDPKADQFIEWVKKIKPEPVAVPVRQGTPIWK